ncbi:MAG TPA: dATP/dGTP pyrophosphohydrolase domain-containing protein [Azospirillum sp.]|nr:dATP/dGTP pyrophosphohydrolase domain-containing protein [Azospirillum sp.]
MWNIEHFRAGLAQVEAKIAGTTDPEALVILQRQRRHMQDLIDTNDAVEVYDQVLTLIFRNFSVNFVGWSSWLLRSLGLLEMDREWVVEECEKRFEVDLDVLDWKVGIGVDFTVGDIVAAIIAARRPPSAEPSFDLIAHLRRQMEWSSRTFGPGYQVSRVLAHLRKELVEVESRPGDLEEWADVISLAFDGAWRAGHSPEQIAAGIAAKLAKNEARQWPDWRTAPPDAPIEHVRKPEEAPHG